MCWKMVFFLPKPISCGKNGLQIKITAKTTIILHKYGFIYEWLENGKIKISWMNTPHECVSQANPNANNSKKKLNWKLFKYENEKLLQVFISCMKCAFCSVQIVHRRCGSSKFCWKHQNQAERKFKWREVMINVKNILFWVHTFYVIVRCVQYWYQCNAED